MKKTMLKSLFTIVGLFALSTVNAAEERVIATVDGIPNFGKSGAQRDGEERGLHRCVK